MWESTPSQAFATEHFTFVCRRSHSSLYYNVTNADACTCDASFAAQPDVAGVGTIVAFATLSMITILFAAIPAYYDSVVRFRAIRRAWKQHKQSRIEAEAEAQPTIRPSRPPLERLETARSNVLSRHFTETGSLENYKSFQDSKPCLRIAEKVLATLCDVQLFTTTSVLIAAYVLGDSLSFYHAGIVTNYYWFAVQSFWASRQNKWWETQPDPLINNSQTRPHKSLRRRFCEFFVQDEPFRLYFRRFLILVCTTLFVVLYGRSIQNEATKWDPTTSGKCYRSGDASDGPSDWFWEAGISVYALVLLLSMAVFAKRAVASLSNALHDSEQNLFAKVGSEWKLAKSCVATEPARFFLRIRHSIWIGVLAVASVLWCIFVQGATNWFFGDGVYVIEVTFYIGMWTWAFYDVVDLKISNRELMIGNENVWTYGQILTLALIGLIVFSTMDSWEDDDRDELEDQRGTDPESGNDKGM